MDAKWGPSWISGFSENSKEGISFIRFYQHIIARGDLETMAKFCKAAMYFTVKDTNSNFKLK